MLKNIVNNKIPKITREDKRLGEEAQKLKNRKKLRLCDAIYAVLDDHNIQDRPTRRDRYYGIRAYLDIKSETSHTAAQEKKERRKMINALQMPLLFK